MSEKSEKKKIAFGFTTIQHDPRIRFQLTNDTYCIADAIYHLSHNPSSISVGWCFASRQTIADFFGISKRSVQRSLAELQAKGLIEIHSTTSFMRTTQKWYDEFVNFALLRQKEALYRG